MWASCPPAAATAQCGKIILNMSNFTSGQTLCKQIRVTANLWCGPIPCCLINLRTAFFWVPLTPVCFQRTPYNDSPPLEDKMLMTFLFIHLSRLWIGLIWTGLPLVISLLVKCLFQMGKWIFFQKNAFKSHNTSWINIILIKILCVACIIPFKFLIHSVHLVFLFFLRPHPWLYSHCLWIRVSSLFLQ